MSGSGDNPGGTTGRIGGQQDSKRRPLRIRPRKRVLTAAFAGAAVFGGLAAQPIVERQPQARAGQVITCPITMTISGEYRRFSAHVPVAGAANPADFAGEAFGKSFGVVAAGLPEGTYTVEIDFAETYHHAAGQRRMRITAGTVVLASDLDPFQAAGGFAKPYTLTGKIEHAADALGGPVAIQFKALTDNANFCAIRIRNAAGDVVAHVRASELSDASDGAGPEASVVPQISDPPIYMDASRPRDSRIDDLIRRMSLREKVAQLMNATPAIPRLNVPAYNYWNEGLHGVARAGHATVFPQAIGLAATWDEPLVHRIGDTISTEARAKYEENSREGKHEHYYGLTFWSPNINIFRDPRWGRGQETYGEDPYLTARTGVAYIEGMQGSDPEFLKTVACAKHFAVHSGPEPGRTSFNAQPPERDLYETYLPQFRAAVQEAHVGSVMASYNAIDGIPSAANHWLLTDLLRGQWGFTGHVVSDCGAVSNIWRAHHYTETAAQAAARAIRAGLDLECGGDFHALPASVAQKLITEKEIDTALHHVLAARFALGLFDPPASVPFAKVPMTEVESPGHLAMARQAARESLVLLKNEGGVLPLNLSKLRKIAVVGANADSVRMLNGNYNGDPSHPITILQGIKDRAATAGVTVEYTRGAPLADDPNAQPGRASADYLLKRDGDLAEAVASARSADAVIYVGGLNANLEGEESGLNIPGFNHGDRTTIELPVVQTDLLKALKATGKPVIFVNCSGSAVAIPWEATHIDAILQAWYPGGEGGAAVADTLFGAYNPSGRLPITVYASTADLPPYDDYRMANRTYRYFGGKPLYAFGHGLSYTTFAYGKPRLGATRVSADGKLQIEVPIRNTGASDGDEVVQVYVRQLKPSQPEPIHALCGYQRISVPKGATGNATFSLDIAQRFRRWDSASKRYVVDPGGYEIQIGAASDDIRVRQVVTVSKM